MDGRLSLPVDMTVELDSQIYTLNWPSRLDRRNIELSCYCNVDTDSRFILVCTVISMTEWDSIVINRGAALNGDMAQKEPFRRYAQYCLAGDELKAERALARKYRAKRDNLAGQITALYAAAVSREDVENIELQDMDPGFCTLLPA